MFDGRCEFGIKLRRPLSVDDVHRRRSVVLTPPVARFLQLSRRTEAAGQRVGSDIDVCASSQRPRWSSVRWSEVRGRGFYGP